MRFKVLLRRFYQTKLPSKIWRSDFPCVTYLVKILPHDSIALRWKIATPQVDEPGILELKIVYTMKCCG